MIPWKLQVSFLISILLSFHFSFGHDSGSCNHHHHHHEDEHHHHHHDHHQCSHGHHAHGHHHERVQLKLLPEELAEEEDLELYGFGHTHDHHEHDSVFELSNLSLWLYAMGCSLLVSLASLICLLILPVLLYKGKPSESFVNSLAAFGAGAMLGDAFLHQLPHAFAGGHSHSHDHHEDHNHDHFHPSQSHSHTLKDLSVGLSTLSGIVLFLLVEKVVRYVEDHSGNVSNTWSHSHHHHSHKKNDDAQDACDVLGSESLDEKNENESEIPLKKKLSDGASEGCLTDKNNIKKESLRQRVTTNGATDEDRPDLAAASGLQSTNLTEKRPGPPSSNLIFGYLNLFSDGVHNFTDGMALGSAFLLHGSVGGWSRTIFLLAHEIPQEIGDFGILVRSGFSVSKALFFNFLSALVALAGTALALLLGQDPGHSSLIEGFTAGGFIYIAVAGVLPEMNSGKSTIKNTAAQLTSLLLGMGVALLISLFE